MKRNIVIIDAPTNLGLRPPEEGVVPGCYKMPWALREKGLLRLLGATEGGTVLPPRYSSKWQQGDGDRNADSIKDFSIALADRTGQYLGSNILPLVIGGDCSILIGNTLALRRNGDYGLVYIDAHSDFRHPGNSPYIASAAGEDLAIITGRGDNRLVNIDGISPYISEKNIYVVGILEDDEDIEEMKKLGIKIATNIEVVKNKNTNKIILNSVANNTGGFWIHIDFDVIDRTEMSAVDCPEDTGISFSVLSELVLPLVSSPKCAGIEITIYDPDLDPHGVYADRIINFLAKTLGKVT